MLSKADNYAISEIILNTVYLRLSSIGALFKHRVVLFNSLSMCRSMIALYPFLYANISHGRKLSGNYEGFVVVLFVNR